MNYQAIWQAALGELELTLSKANFTTWFKNTFISVFENGKVIVAVPNTFTKSWLERKYHDPIIKALRSATNEGVRELSFRVEVKNTTVLPLEHLLPETLIEPQERAQTTRAGQPAEPAGPDTPQDAGADNQGLNPRYVFENFVVGKNNELAHAACQAVAAKPGEVYNPLFIYGGAGMGKTHLLQAVGHHLLKDRPALKLRYVTCERFTNEFIQAVRSGHASEFKGQYRTVDALLVDDVQFLTGKEGTQEEFFHTFNTLHQNNKQIVLTADRCPKDIQGLESRLLSRFEWGMIVDISRPDFETRVAILESKTREKKYALSVDALHMIAGAIQSNVRELEGALNKIIAYHQFKNLQPTIASIQPLLQTFSPSFNQHNISPKILLEAVVTHYEITLDDILGKSRERRFALPRQIAMFLLREETKCSFPAIGDHVGNRDHTTAMHACQKINSLLKNDSQIKRDLSLIRERLYSHST